MVAKASGIRLSAADAGTVKGMLARGDRQHDIAAWFGVNSGRVAEIANGTAFKSVPPQVSFLPPPGPYQSGRESYAMMQVLSEVKALLDRHADVFRS